MSNESLVEIEIHAQDHLYGFRALVKQSDFDKIDFASDGCACDFHIHRVGITSDGILDDVDRDNMIPLGDWDLDEGAEKEEGPKPLVEIEQDMILRFPDGILDASSGIGGNLTPAFFDQINAQSKAGYMATEDLVLHTHQEVLDAIDAGKLVPVRGDE